jgi:hypothetical protein
MCFFECRTGARAVLGHVQETVCLVRSTCCADPAYLSREADSGSGLSLSPGCRLPGGWATTHNFEQRGEIYGGRVAWREAEAARREEARGAGSGEADGPSLDL